MSQIFNKAKIYKITNDFNDEVYIGSTCETLTKRFSKHKASLTNEQKYNRPLYKLMNEIGFERFRIQLLCDFPCEDKYQLRQKEGEYIRDLGTLNMTIAGRTNKDYAAEHKELYQDIKRRYAERNKDDIVTRQHNWYQENKERILLKQKELYEANKESINQKKKEYYEKNKEKIKIKYLAKKLNNTQNDVKVAF